MNFPWKLLRRHRLPLAALALFALLFCVYTWKHGAVHSKDHRRHFRRPETSRKGSPLCLSSYPEETRSVHNTHDLYAETSGQRTIARSNGTLRQKIGNDKLKVFVVPMTHVDPGWLKTFDGYSEDTNNILDNMLAFMPKNPQMRFIWCEMVFLERWFRALSEEKKEEVRKLVKTGQLELASGSWVMTDEANPFLPITVDNIVEGQQFVFKEFGVYPTTIWSNDPFGYSNAVPYLFTKTGIHRAVINRIHHGLKQSLQSYKAIPFTWKQYFDQSKKSDVLTNVLPYQHYDVLNSCGPNSGVCCQFDFRRITDWHCSAGFSAEAISDANVQTKSAALVGQLAEMSKMYQSNVLLMMLGDDFRYDSIGEWHQQHDNFVKLFEHINAKGDAEIRFGTFADYFGALEEFNAAQKIEAPSLTGDFFPYTCALGDDWTGYFTTRPFYKRRERLLHSLIRAADLLSVRATPSFEATTLNQINDVLIMARRNLSLFQHHDAITGTSKVRVMRNYGELLHNATLQSSAILEASLKALGNSKFHAYEVPIAYNASAEKELLVVEKFRTITLAIFNSLPQSRLESILVQVNTVNVKVVDENGVAIEAQIEPFVIRGKGVSKKSFSLVFHVDLPRLATKQVQILHEDSPKSTSIASIETVERQNLAFPLETEFPKEFNPKTVESSAISIKTKQVETTHSARTGLLETMKTSSSSEATKLIQKMMRYKDSRGGPYLIRSDKNSVEEFGEAGFVFAVKGELQQSVHVMSRFFSNHFVARDVPGPEGANLYVGMHVDIRSLQNSEAIVRFGLGSKSLHFFTDSIGLHMTRRDYFSNVNVGKNYYPMPSAMFVQDGTKRITVVSNVEHGCSGQEDGFEIMLDRTMSMDDGKGLGYDDSFLTDLIPIDIDFAIILDSVHARLPDHFAYNSQNAHRALQALMYRPVLFTAKEGISSSLTPSTPESFPCDVQLLTVRPMTAGYNRFEKLMILHRPGLECSSKSEETCSSEALTESVRSYLEELGVKEVAKTNLNGLVVEGAFQALGNVHFSVEPMDFASYRLKLGDLSKVTIDLRRQSPRSSVSSIASGTKNSFSRFFVLNFCRIGALWRRRRELGPLATVDVAASSQRLSPRSLQSRTRRPSTAMTLIPASYDPYNNVSFLELNKQRRGEGDRREEDRIYNRRPPPVKKIFLRRNGDFSSKPKRFVWKVWQSRELENLMEDAGSFLGVEARELFDDRGRRITDTDQVADGGTYTVVGDEHYDRGVPSEASLRVRRARSRVAADDFNRAYREAMRDKDHTVYSIDYNDHAPPQVKSPAVTDFYENNSEWNPPDAYLQDYYGNQSETAPSRHTDPGPSRVKDDYALDYRKQNRDAPRTHAERHRARRPRSAVIYNRRDQTHPEANIIYVFLNGRGLECRHVRFQKAQLQRGFGFILELIARGYSVSPGRLCAMDGRRIRKIDDLVTRGAYIIVPVGQNFRDTWYYLPRNAIDTSTSKNEQGSQERPRHQPRAKRGVIPSNDTRQNVQQQPLVQSSDPRKSRMSEYENGRQSAFTSTTNGGRRSYSLGPQPRRQIPTD
ncbi:hypothetical protein QR680_017608 [Steinernema hermaphroditum]|uniref:Doublecortin domain-containing protein n=1 Tax=Steinernema hermaphroditum TaxID=289476 RepID=A0AA39LPP4_9BILA|nr:hypothetical protein QR680_017608 [Steinernema hermaphroditum]